MTITWGYAVSAHEGVVGEAGTLLTSYPDVLMATVAAGLLLAVGLISAGRPPPDGLRDLPRDVVFRQELDHIAAARGATGHYVLGSRHQLGTDPLSAARLRAWSPACTGRRLISASRRA